MPEHQRWTPRTPERKTFASMSQDERRAWLTEKYAWLLDKRQREQHYLDRRARQGISTPTDDDYQADAPHELDLLKFFEELAEGLM